MSTSARPFHRERRAGELRAGDEGAAPEVAISGESSDRADSGEVLEVLEVAESDDFSVHMSDVDAAFARLLAPAEVSPPSETVAAQPRPATVTHGTSTAADRAAVRATFEELAAVHVSPLRNFMLEVRWGEAPTRFVALARPSLHSLRAMAAELELDDLVRALDNFDGALGVAASNENARILGPVREALLGAYFPLMSGFAGAFHLDGGRERREPIIIDALLDPVPGIDQDVLDRLCMVGLGRLEPLLKARADEIAVVANLPRSIAERIVERVAELVRQAPPGLAQRVESGREVGRRRGTGRSARAPRTLLEWLTAELTRDQAVLKLRRGETIEALDLQELDLSRARLEEANLGGVDLTCARLDGACLREANLRKARLRAINLADADLSHADLEGADLRGAHLRGARLIGANLSRANLTSADLTNANLEGARLSFATFGFAKLGGARLEGANAVHADFEQASLRGVQAKGADLSAAHFKGALLEQGDFRQALLADAVLERVRASGANFAGANLAGADLHDGDLSRVDLTEATLFGALLDDATLTGAKVAGLVPSGIPARRLRADWIEGAIDQEIVVALTGGRGGWQRPHGGSHYFGPGEVLRNVVLELGPGTSVAIDSLFDGCIVRMEAGSELVLGPNGVMADCRILGGGDLTIQGHFFEGESPGIVGPRALSVAGGAVLCASVEQAPGNTRFAIAHGARLRLQILNPRPRSAAQKGTSDGR